jgi:predicted amidohydrolase YtcJ
VNWIAATDMPRFRKLNVVAEVSPMLWFPTPVTPVIEHFLGRARTARLNPIGSLLKAGAPLAVGSDWPAGTPTPDPWIGIEGMVTRRNPLGQMPGVMAAGERLPLPEALRLYTRSNAEAMGIGDVTGSIDVGKSADLIVLDQHLFQVPVERIHRTRVLSTYLQGHLVHSATPSAPTPAGAH